jgi:lysozyme
MACETPIDVAVKLVKEFEGLELTAYPDPGTGAEPYTIGYGATGPGIKKGVVWTQAMADARLAQDLKRFADGVAAVVKVATNQNQMGAMISLAYNIGLGAFSGSTLLRKLNAGDYKGAQEQFSRWNRAGGRVMRGLTRRRNAEAAVFGTKP